MVLYWLYGCRDNWASFSDWPVEGSTASHLGVSRHSERNLEPTICLVTLQPEHQSRFTSTFSDEIFYSSVYLWAWGHSPPPQCNIKCKIPIFPLECQKQVSHLWVLLNLMKPLFSKQANIWDKVKLCHDIGRLYSPLRKETMKNLNELSQLSVFGSNRHFKEGKIQWKSTQSHW